VSVIEFGYTKYRNMMVPMIPIKFKGEERWFEFWAFVDSGATYSIFASKEAEGLGIDIKQGKKGWFGCRVYTFHKGKSASPICLGLFLRQNIW